MKRYIYQVEIPHKPTKYTNNISEIVKYLRENLLDEKVSRDQVENHIRRPTKSKKDWRGYVKIERVRVKNSRAAEKVESDSGSDEEVEIRELEEYALATQEELNELKVAIQVKRFNLLCKKGIKAEDCIMKEKNPLDYECIL